ncbi:MAG: VanZ family protein [Bacteroidetes bacterium]|nr:VanZ family protein [Bacteroidota bacterium]
MNFKELPDFTRFQVPLLIWMAFIFALSSIPGSALSPYEFMDAHLIAHSLLFGVLYYLGYRAFKHQHYSRFVSEFSLLITLLFVMAYGASDEYHQSFTPGRSEELKDFLWDLSAAVVVLFIVLIVEKFRERRKMSRTSVEAKDLRE